VCLNRKMLCHGKPHEILNPQELTSLFGEGGFYQHEKEAHHH
jgi:ABC-type Mn2+/Zn2+ transport system ATPase subunit